MEYDQKEPIRQFRGWFIPAHIIDLFDNRILTTMDLILLSTVDSLMDPVRGCYASNAYLATQVGYSDVRSIPRRLKKYKELGLIEVRMTSDRQNRSIWTTWNQLPQTSKRRVAKWPHPCGQMATLINLDKKTLPSPTPAASEEERMSDGFGLFGKDKKKPDTESYRLADYLKAIILSHTSRNPRINLTSWAQEISKLQREGVSIETVEDMLGWFEDHIQDQYTPVVRSAKSFREKFDNLVAARQRSLEKQKKNPSPQKVTLSEDGKKVLEKLQRLSWPESAKPQLPGLIQESSRAVTILRSEAKDRLSKVVIELREQMALKSFLNQTNHSAILSHFTKTQKQIENWKTWGGSMESFRFVFGKPAFDPWVLESFNKYACAKLGRSLLESATEKYESSSQR